MQLTENCCTRATFALTEVHVGCAMALGQVSLPVLRFSPVSIIPPSLFTHVPSGMWSMGPFAAALRQVVWTGRNNKKTPTAVNITPMRRSWIWLAVENAVHGDRRLLAPQRRRSISTRHPRRQTSLHSSPWEPYLSSTIHNVSSSGKVQRADLVSHWWT